MFLNEIKAVGITQMELVYFIAKRSSVDGIDKFVNLMI